VNGHVDRFDRAIVTLFIRQTSDAEPVELPAWVDTAFTGELVVPRQTIEALRLPQSSVVTAGLADGTQALLDTFSCVIDWFDERRVVEVIESEGQLALLGVGLLHNCKLEIDYRLRTLTIN
jgi:clan AA aspartic protease